MGAKLKDVSYSIKQNGIMVNIDYTEPINDDDIIGWKSDRGWVYLTLLGVRSPKNIKPKQNFSGVVRKIVIDDFDESTQLAILVKKPILGYDIINSKTSPSTIVFIHTEMKKSEVANLKQHIKKKGSSVFNIAKSSGFPKYNTNFKNAFDEARKELGPNAIFEYHGKLYTTNHPGEKEALSKSVLLKRSIGPIDDGNNNQFSLRNIDKIIKPDSLLNEVYIENSTGEVFTEKIVKSSGSSENDLESKNLKIKNKNDDGWFSGGFPAYKAGGGQAQIKKELIAPKDTVIQKNKPILAESSNDVPKTRIFKKVFDLFKRKKSQGIKDKSPSPNYKKLQKEFIPPLDEDIVMDVVDQNVFAESKTQQSDTSIVVKINKGNFVDYLNLKDLQEKYIPPESNKIAFESFRDKDTLKMPQYYETLTQASDTNIVEAWFLDESIIPDEYDATRLQEKYIPPESNKIAFESFRDKDTLKMPQYYETLTQASDTNIVEAWFLDESIIPDEYDATRLQEKYIPPESNKIAFKFLEEDLSYEPSPQTPEFTDPIVLDNRFKTRYKNNTINKKTNKNEDMIFSEDSLEKNTWLSYFPTQEDSIKKLLKWDFAEEREVPSFLQNERESLDYSSRGNQDRYEWRSQLPNKRPKSFPKRQSDPGFMFYNNGGIKVESNLKGVPIYIDGKYVGETPISVPVEVEPGWHQVSGFSPMYTHLASSKGLQFVGYDSIIQNNELYGATTVYSEPGKLETVVLKFNQMGDKPKKLSEIKGGMNIGLPMFTFLLSMIFWSM